MKALLVNGSPKARDSASGSILDSLAAALGPGMETRRLRAITAKEAEPADLEAEVLVLAFPLYVDSLPAPLLEWLLSYAALARARGATARPAAVYAICNCGFLEGAQTETALAIVRNFARSSGLRWGGAIGLGGGGMFEPMAKLPPEAAIKRPVSRAMDWLAGLIRGGEAPGEARYAQFAFPRLAYILAAHLGWRRQARANGLRPREIGKRLA
ncbi:MAG TPA: NAD(P)H-dependent oxidoreductase [Spirochaetales bacterium]|nr:NAD(P)H-dependent oxidoreductase [Spirochaetales bacterium]HRY53799.1 NAD(P)H-dependent oxidoreductase [Spirochaetia bacterium]HRZ64638.1 NAD(P)H-dependent oxidoreductase [Spirochaetia bacterium]